MEKEIWLPIKEFEGYYEVSNLGRIKSLKRVKTKVNKFGTKIPILINEKIIVGTDKYKHKCINLINETQKLKTSIHREVYKAFIGDIPKKYVINHINGNKCDNNINNLECVTQSDNIKHAYLTGLIVRKRKI